MKWLTVGMGLVTGGVSAIILGACLGFWYGQYKAAREIDSFLRITKVELEKVLALALASEPPREHKSNVTMIH